MRPNGQWDENTMANNSRYRLSEDGLALRIENVMYEDRGELGPCVFIFVEKSRVFQVY